MEPALGHSAMLGLLPGGVLRLRDPSGRRIGAVHGNVRVTQDRDPRDRVAGGESVRFDRNGLALVTPLGGAATIARGRAGSRKGSRARGRVMPTVDLATLASGFQPVTGAPISIRPLRAEDYAIEEAFIRGLSRETRSERLLGGARAITPEYVARLTRVDYPRELALAAVVMLEERETLIGVARYARDAVDETCEFALVVADAWQGHGVGKRLLEALLAAALRHGIRRMAGYTLSMNRAMLGLARRLGFRAQRVPGDATLTEVVLDLSPAH